MIINRLVKFDMCVGCGICESKYGKEAIEVKINAEGYFRPFVNSVSSIDCDLFKKLCPAIYINNRNQRDYDIRWGAIRQLSVGYASDQEIRFKASSGGVISALLVYLLEQNLVDFVLHIGACSENPVRNEVKVSRDRNDVLNSAGSRYSPSAPLKEIGSYLNGEEIFAFVGKPCDIAALRNYADIDQRVGKKVKYYISFMCAGVPSERGTLELINAMGASRQEVKQFRYRGYGWPGKATARLINDDELSMDYSTAWGCILNKHLQIRCKVCPDGIGEQADVVCGDAWESKSGYPDFTERKGKSLVLARNEVGAILLNNCEKGGYIQTESLGKESLENIQQYQLDRKKYALTRILGVFIRSGIIIKASNYRLFSNILRGNYLTALKNLLGTILRTKNCES